MMDLKVLLTTFGMILLAELGDKKHHKNQTARLE